MEWLILPLTILALAFLINGFPTLININKNYYDSKPGDKKDNQG